jgi:hypothetical protein
MAGVEELSMSFLNLLQQRLPPCWATTLPQIRVEQMKWYPHELQEELVVQVPVLHAPTRGSGVAYDHNTRELGLPEQRQQFGIADWLNWLKERSRATRIGK